MMFARLPALVLAIFLLLFSTAEAQESGLAKSAALFVGGGPGTVRSAAFVAGVDVDTRLGLIQGRAMTARETYALFPSEVPVEKNYDFGLLYGWRVPITAELFASLTAGISSTTVVRRGAFKSGGGVLNGAEYEKLRTWTVGFPFELRLQLTEENDKGGIFLALEGTLNNADTYGGLMLGAFFWV